MILSVSSTHITRHILKDAILSDATIKITFSDPENILDDDDPEDDYGGSVASFTDGRRNILAYFIGQDTRFVKFHDLRRNVTVRKPLLPIAQTIVDLAFSFGGQHLVVAHSVHLSVFGCNYDKIEDIGESRMFFHLPDYDYANISCSPFTQSRFAVGCMH